MMDVPVVICAAMSLEMMHPVSPLNVVISQSIVKMIHIVRADAVVWEVSVIVESNINGIINR